jgi:hypothetical protein
MKLPNCQYNQTADEVLKELSKVYFLYANAIDDPLGDRGNHIWSCEMNREDCNLATNEITESKVRFILSTFKPRKSKETYEIEPVLVQRGTNYVVSRLRCVLGVYLAHVHIP